MTTTPVHHRAKGARITACGRAMSMDMGHGAWRIGERVETVSRDPRETDCEGCLKARAQPAAA